MRLPEQHSRRRVALRRRRHQRTRASALGCGGRFVVAIDFELAAQRFEPRDLALEFTQTTVGFGRGL